MNRNADEQQRGPGDFILFGMMFVGFVAGVTGLMTSSIGGAVTGLVLMGVAVLGFMVKSGECC